MDNTVTATPFHILQTDSLQQTLVLRNVNRQHPHFCFNDGDLLLASSSVDFRVHVRKVVARSAVLTHRFQYFSAEGMLYVPILDDDPEDWACLLGLIYDEGGNSLVFPSLQELLAVIRVASKYGFSTIEGWATARLRADFFPHPQHFQDDETSPQAEEKLLNALTVIAASHHSQIETAVLALAYYAIARRDPNAPRTMKHSRCMSRLALKRVLKGHSVMERHFEGISNTFLELAHLRKPTCTHCPQTCGKLLVEWAADARTAHLDALKALRHMRDETPPGPVCLICVREARSLVHERTVSVYCSMPTFFELGEVLEYGWELAEDRKRFLLESFRP